MSNIKKLMMTAASGGDIIDVDDVFSTYLYEGNSSAQKINNGIQLDDGDTGAVEFTTPGTYTWTCPSGVSSVDVVCVGGGGAYQQGGGGGGGLGYKNNISVTAGSTYTVVVGEGGKGDYSNTQPTDGDSYFISTSTVKGGSGSYASGGTYTGDGGGNGGDGGYFRAGGGAGGYSGDGGDCASNYGNGNAGSGGGGGGGGQGIGGGYVQFAAGGGVGIYGQGSNGAGGTGGTTVQAGGGGGGSGGYYGSNSNGTYAPGGGLYGGGAGTAVIGGSYHEGDGGSGAVRIVYRSGSSFPSTNVGFTSNGEGQGGMVWFKSRDGSNQYPTILDTDRGVHQLLQTSQNWAETNGNASTYPPNGSLPEFKGDGFVVGSYDDLNKSGESFASWTFRKTPKFFDIITATSTGSSSRVLSHNLGCDVGFAVVKDRDQSSNWISRHRSMTSGQNINLNTSAAAFTFSGVVSFDSTTITINESNFLGTGRDYVVYLFAHNDGDGGFGPNADQDIIKCGSYTGDGTTNATNIVDVGFEPQWLLVRKTSGSGNWFILDTMRGFVANTTQGNNGQDVPLNSDTTYTESQNLYAWASPTPNGFALENNFSSFNESGGNYIYVAIRRGPLAPPTEATSVFNVLKETSFDLNENPPFLQKTGWPVDVVINRSIAGSNWWTGTRLTGARVQLDTDDAETATRTTHHWDYNTGVAVNGLTPATNFMGYHFRRAPEFFDVVSYRGDGTANQTFSHNLGVKPSMVWLKNRSRTASGSTGMWVWVDDSITTNEGRLSSNNDFGANVIGTVTSTTVQTLYTNQYATNFNGDYYVAYLFGSLDGISKVGSYTGNGSTQTIDCGFSNGARFVLIKRTDNTGSWVLFDTERGIVSGNDSALYVQSTNAEVTSIDWIDPNSSGFDIATSQSNINANGGSYIFYAIA